MKDRALAPIMALSQEKMYAGMAGKSEGLRRIGAVLAAMDNDQPFPKFDDTSLKSQTAAHPVKPSQTNKARVKPVKPPSGPPPGGASACETTDPLPPPVENADLSSLALAKGDKS
jgi:hypothetical protein